MELVHRSALPTLLLGETTEFKRHCFSFSPQVLHSVTEKWIKKKTEYAILSHRWLSGGELTYPDLLKFAGHQDTLLQLINFHSPTKGRDIVNELGPLMNQSYEDLFPTDQDKTRFPSFVKLIIFCWISALHSCRFVWFDTGCIDKTSSAELDESIRSMFNWYSKSEVCIVQLADTTDVSSFRKDQWFTRGWTLQELLAPKRIKFFGKLWRPITSSSFCDNDKIFDSHLNRHLWDHIEDITKISPENISTFNSGIGHARNALVWLSKRQTTRTEDMAYCLIGLLGVPLTIAYGEGEMAFYRLQVEIIQGTADMGLFIWEGQSSVGNSMLAARPHSFSSLTCRPISSPTLKADGDRSFSLTNLGLRIPLLVYGIPADKWSMNQNDNYPAITLRMVNQTPITMMLQTREDFDLVELAFLGEADSDGQKGDLAILLGSKGGQWKRISKKYTILPRPSGTTLQTRFIR